MFEVNANGNRSFASCSAPSVAMVAEAWRKQGHDPVAFAIGERNGMVSFEAVPVGTARQTSRALQAAAKAIN